MDDIFIINQALTDAQVKKSFGKPNVKTTTSTPAFSPFIDKLHSRITTIEGISGKSETGRRGLGVTPRYIVYSVHPTHSACMPSFGSLRAHTCSLGNMSTAMLAPSLLLAPGSYLPPTKERHRHRVWNHPFACAVYH